ncbi:MAG: VPS10 domain-containing protein [Gemmatimonadaceae bacterium]
MQAFTICGASRAALMLLALPLAAGAQRVAYDSALWSGMHYRMIGPERGGRVTTVTGVPSQPRTFYMGTTGGGVWKTTDAGASWRNVTDGFLAVGSIGAVEVSRSDPNIVYVGTGSSKIRSNVSIGRGLYKSTDGGHSWTLVGLKSAGQIAAVRIDPTDPDLVYVAAQGNPFVPNVERGVYRTRDGGRSWQKILYVSDSTGATDLELQPGHPGVIFAAMWHGQRKPWTIVSGAYEGGIYKSSDGGDSWTKLGGGLPDQLFGRSNVAISRAMPNRIYALIEAKPGGGLYRSEDSGATWTLVNASPSLWTRPFYYTTLGVDPNDPDVVYVGDEGWFKSTDGGKTFRSEPVPHGDNHDLWINPDNSDAMIQSNDGGANVSLDGGRTWSSQLNQPTAEIYQVAVDSQYPYRVYGAQQDDNTLIVPSLPLGNGQEWREGPGCETGPIIPNTINPDTVYGSCKGQFSRLNLNTANEQQYWVGAQSLYGNGGAGLIYRFQRVSPMEVSPYDPNTVYYGSQYVHRTRDEGVTWTRISPDLTWNPPGAPQEASGTPITRDATGEEVYSTLYSIRESPVKRGIIWTGSNDGLVYVTRDDGKTWTNVTPKGLQPGGRVQNIEPSPRRPGSAYVAIYRFLLGDFAPYIYRTDDYGASWTLLTNGRNGIPGDSPTRVVREDPDRAGLLYAGTEFGMYVSFDNGERWQSFQMNLPVTPITDIKVAHDALVISTQGRSFWILDNLSPLHQLTAQVAQSTAHLFAPERAVRHGARAGFGGDRGGAGPEYPAPGAQIDYYIGSPPAGDVVLQILDGSGTVIQTFSSAAPAPVPRGGGAGGFRGRPATARVEKSVGMHRFTWDLRYPGPWESPARPQGPNGPMAAPGRYSVRLTVGSSTSTQPFTLIEDPRVTRDGVTTGDLQAQLAHNLRTRALVSAVNQLVARLTAARDRLSGATGAAADTLARVTELAGHLITPAIRYSKPELQTHIVYLYGMTNDADQKIGRDAVERYEVLKKELDERIRQANAILGPGN